MRAARPRARFRLPPACAALAFALAPSALAQAPEPEAATPPARAAPGSPYAAHIAEAARRFAIPERWIWAVMRAESGGNRHAVSRAGAMGLMQIMPRTWAELRARYGLGRDPFDVRDNIMAGAAYLREMHDAFGSPGFLAAYNAGPNRYTEYLRDGRALPGETRGYMARVGRDIGATAAPTTSPGATVQRDWTHAAIFVARAVDAQPEHTADAAPAHGEAIADAPAPRAPAPPSEPEGSLFITRQAPPR